MTDVRRRSDFNDISHRPRCLVYLPFAPLWEASGVETVSELARVCGVSYRQVERWKVFGVPARRADTLACRLGLHPVSVWGLAYECLPI